GCALEVRDYWRRGLRIPYPPPLLLRHADEYLAPSPPRGGRGGTGRVARLRRFAAGDQRTRIFSGAEPADQPLPAGLNFGEGQASARPSSRTTWRRRRSGGGSRRLHQRQQVVDLVARDGDDERAADDHHVPADRVGR